MFESIQILCGVNIYIYIYLERWDDTVVPCVIFSGMKAW